MKDITERRTDIAHARAAFLHSGSAETHAVPDIVAASWQRSFSAGVDAATSLAVFHDDLDTSSRLVRSAEPVIARLSDEMAQMPLSIVLTDNKARILSRSETDRTIGQLLDKVSLAPGFNYAESSVGTNGIGTVFESGQPLYIVGPEHFHEKLQPFACAGSPIRDSMTGRIEGVLDMSCLSEDSSPLMQSLVRSAAHDIERNLLNDRSRCQQALFEAFVRLDARRRGAVMAIGDSAVMSNTIAQSMFEPTEQWIIHQHARYLMTSQESPFDRAELPSGRVVQLRGTRIVVGTDLAGIVVAVDVVSEASVEYLPAPVPIEHQSSAPSVPPAAVSQFTHDTADSTADGDSLLWKRAATEISSALLHDRALIVRGESGTGKTTLITDLFRRLHPDGDCVVLGPDTELPTTLPQSTKDAGCSTLFVFAHLDRMSPGHASQLSLLLQTARATGAQSYITATVSEEDLRTDDGFTMLLSRFDDSVTLAPLRLRVGDIPLVVRRVLERVTGRRYLAVSAASMRVLKSYDWPGNIPQVEEAMKFAVRNRPVGEIQPSDLPGYCHTDDHRQLSALETSERDIIISALQDAAGNRVHAATALGISRSSLYRKLKSFGIIAA